MTEENTTEVQQNKGGAPLGNQNGANFRRWQAALERSIAAYPEMPDITNCNAFMIGINKAAHAFVVKMIDTKDIQFFKEFGDRLDGKAKQQTELTGADGKDLFPAMVAGADELREHLRGQ